MRSAPRVMWCGPVVFVVGIVAATGCSPDPLPDELPSGHPARWESSGGERSTRTARPSGAELLDLEAARSRDEDLPPARDPAAAHHGHGQHSPAAPQEHGDQAGEHEARGEEPATPDDAQGDSRDERPSSGANNSDANVGHGAGHAH